MVDLYSFAIFRFGQLFFALFILLFDKLFRLLFSLFTSILPFTIFEKQKREKFWDWGTIELINYLGYEAESHWAITKDEYYLTLHRILPKKERKGVILFLHGFCQSSEAFVSRLNAENCLPTELAKEGYDVFLGNIRGNKYSSKSRRYKVSEQKFWDFSLDEYAQYDLPAMIEKVLSITKAEKITYAGFSQGTAVGFACFSSFPEIASKINLFIAIAPCVYLKGLHNPIAHAVAETRPDFSYLIFGKKIFMGNNMYWRNVLAPKSWVDLMDASQKLLFNWTKKSLDPNEKEMLYSHLYSTTSVKSVIHWFQILHHARFQMFDASMNSKANGYSEQQMPIYDISHFPVPTAMLSGKDDTLPDTDKLRETLPSSCLVHTQEFEGYEHLDLMWAKDTGTTVIPVLKRLLEEHTQK